MLQTFDTGKNIKGDMRGMKKVPIPATLLAHVYHMCRHVPILLSLLKTSTLILTYAHIHNI